MMKTSVLGPLDLLYQKEGGIIESLSFSLGEMEAVLMTLFKVTEPSLLALSP